MHVLLDFICFMSLGYYLNLIDFIYFIGKKRLSQDVCVHGLRDSLPLNSDPVANEYCNNVATERRVANQQ